MKQKIYSSTWTAEIKVATYTRVSGKEITNEGPQEISLRNSVESFFILLQHLKRCKMAGANPCSFHAKDTFNVSHFDSLLVSFKKLWYPAIPCNEWTQIIS
jgi:hypothetical protein